MTSPRQWDVVLGLCQSPGLTEPSSYLHYASLTAYARCCRMARRRAAAAWLAEERALKEFDRQRLVGELRSLWELHGSAITAPSARRRPLQSAGDMYRCWPSTHWFGKAPLPFKDYIDFEMGDSSYNIWIFDLATALPMVGRIATDLYLRMSWPLSGTEDARLLQAVSTSSAFIEEITKQLPEAGEDEDDDGDVRDGWDFKMRPVYQLMKQIWWDAASRHEEVLRRCTGWQQVLSRRPELREGPLVPRRPMPLDGLSLRYSQESVFMTWDRHELWVYGCYVD